MAKVSNIEEKTQKQILDIIVNKDDVSWKTIIFGLIENEQMDPWDINISLISQRFLEELKKLKEMDFRISGKVVLASAILLKLKAERLRDEELAALENLINSADEPIDLGLDELQSFEEPDYVKDGRPQLIPRTPQPRKRKVSVYDLVEALENALETDANRPSYAPPKTLDVINPPEHHIDISLIIKEVYERVYGHYQKSTEKLKFHSITRSNDPKDVVMAFIPLLHLENARKVHMEQPEHFGPIDIHLLEQQEKKDEVVKEPQVAKKAEKKKSKKG